MCLKHNAIFVKKNNMEIFEKVRFFREQKKLSQEYISTLLNIEQSQFSRRESGQIPFSINDLEKLSELLDVDVTHFFKNNTVVFTSNNQSGGSLGQYVSIPDRLIEQYELRIKEKDDLIQLLQEQIEKRDR